MNLLEISVGIVLPYVSLVILIAGLAYKIRKWQKGGVANLAIYPAASSKWELWRKILGEILLFSTFRKEHKALWSQTWVLHAMLLLIIMGHTRLITDWPLRVLLGMSESSVDTFSAWAGGIAGLLAMFTCTFLIFRRLTLQRVREASTGEDYLVMIILLLILVTGNIMRFYTHFDIALARTYFATLFSFQPVQVPGDPMFLLHFTLVQILLIILPFGKLLHIPGVFYSKALTAKDY
jgi:nitrate reductase gamma subunit